LSIDYRVTSSTILRDSCVDRKVAKDDWGIMEDDYYRKRLDELKNKEIVRERRRAMEEGQRREAIARKEIDLEKKGNVSEMKLKYLSDFGIIGAKKENEMKMARELKESVADMVPNVLVDMKEKKMKEGEEFRREMRKMIREAKKKERNDILEKVFYQAPHQKAKENAQRGTNSVHRDPIAIESKEYLSAISDQEAERIRMKEIKENQKFIEKSIEEHKAQKEQKLNMHVGLMNQLQVSRDKREDDFLEHRERMRIEKKNEELKRVENEEKMAIEFQRKCLEKKTKQIREAKKENKILQRISERNKILSKSKAEFFNNAFDYQQDGRLRCAKFRVNPEEKKINRKSTELISIKGFLGIK